MINKKWYVTTAGNICRNNRYLNTRYLPPFERILYLFTKKMKQCSKAFISCLCLALLQAIRFRKRAISRVGELLYDRAELSGSLYEFTRQAVNSQCFECSRTIVVGKSETTSDVTCATLLYTPHEWTLYSVPTDDPDRFSTLTYTFGDQGRYQLSEQDGFIDITVVKAPVDYLAPLFVLLAVLFFLVFISFVGPPAYNYAIDKYVLRRLPSMQIRYVQ